MKLFRRIINATYPLRMRISQISGLGVKKNINHQQIKPIEDFYGLRAQKNNDEWIDFSDFKGKKVLIVNVAGECGYTPQYAQLERLHQSNSEIIILAFPANDFKNQEPGDDASIAQFCEINYGITFPIFKKDVVTGKEKQPVFEWLSNQSKNGWCNQEPQWNFCKYLIDENGILMGYFSSAILPADVFNEF